MAEAERERVLLCNTRFEPHVGGVETSLRELARALEARGHAVCIVAGDAHPAGTPRPPRLDHAYGAEVHRYRAFPRALAPVGLLGAVLVLLRLRWRVRPTRVVARHHMLVLALRLAGYRDVTYVVPTVARRVQHHTARVAPGSAEAGSVRGRIVAVAQRLALRWSRRVVTFSDFMADLVAAEGVPRGRIVVQPPGVDRDRFAPMDAVERRAAREALGLPRDARLALSLGRFVPEKGVDLAIDAAAALAERWTLVVVGDGPERATIERHLAGLPANVRVLVRPRTSEPERYLHAVDAFVLSSRYEPFGQVLLEAVASGVPVVAFARAAGVETATEELFADVPALVRYADRLDGPSLAAAIDASHDASLHPAYDQQRASFLARHDWGTLAELIAAPPLRR